MIHQTFLLLVMPLSKVDHSQNAGVLTHGNVLQLKHAVFACCLHYAIVGMIDKVFITSIGAMPKFKNKNFIIFAEILTPIYTPCFIKLSSPKLY